MAGAHSGGCARAVAPPTWHVPAAGHRESCSLRAGYRANRRTFLVITFYFFVPPHQARFSMPLLPFMWDFLSAALGRPPFSACAQTARPSCPRCTGCARRARPRPPRNLGFYTCGCGDRVAHADLARCARGAGLQPPLPPSQIRPLFGHHSITHLRTNLLQEACG
ncbi:MAG: hypothetical protein J3K34DRAFT_519591, partial [Monoraphidium minutum]